MQARPHRVSLTLLIVSLGIGPAACNSQPGRVDPAPSPVVATAAVKVSPPPVATDAATGPTMAADGIPSMLTGRVWQLTGFADGSAITEALPGHEPSLTFAAGAVAGSGGCNSFSSSVTFGTKGADGQRMELSQIAVTLMACEDPLLNDQETRFLDYLGRVAGFRMPDADSLVLEDATGRVGLHFTASAQP